VNNIVSGICLMQFSFVCSKCPKVKHEADADLVWFVGFFQTLSLKDASFNFVQFLQELASEQKFEVTYRDLGQIPNTGISAGVTRWGLLV